MTYISWSSDFVLYLEVYLMYKHNTFGLWDSLEEIFDVETSYLRIISQYDPKFDTKINVGQSDQYFLLHYFALYFEEYLMY